MENHSNNYWRGKKKDPVQHLMPVAIERRVGFGQRARQSRGGGGPHQPGTAGRLGGHRLRSHSKPGEQAGEQASDDAISVYDNVPQVQSYQSVRSRLFVNGKRAYNKLLLVECIAG